MADLAILSEDARQALSDQSKPWQVAHGVRTALRSLISHDNPQSINDERCLLFSFRAVHSGYAWVNEQTEEFAAKAREAYETANHSTSQPGLSEGRSLSVFPCGDVAWAVGNDAAESAVRTLEEALNVYAFETPNSDQTYLIDCFEVDVSSAQTLDTCGMLFSTELNDPATLSESIIRTENAFVDMLQTKEKTWSFWLEWYQGFLDGNPLNWELLRRVALIDDSSWAAGPEAVAREIEKLRAQFDLEQRIDELETELRLSSIDRHGVGGNMPPEPLEEAPFARELIIIWQPVEVLKDEVSKNDPDPKRLQLAIEALATALNRGLAWCLKKGDLIVDTTIKWAVPAGGTGYLALNPEKLEAVIEAAKKLLGVL